MPQRAIFQAHKIVSILSRPKAAARAMLCQRSSSRFQLTVVRRRLHEAKNELASISAFQLIAARRRLRRVVPAAWCARRFNSQPPEGGCLRCFLLTASGLWFQLTAARGRLPGRPCRRCSPFCMFQLTAARRQLQTAQDFYSQSNMFQLTAFIAVNPKCQRHHFLSFGGQGS